MITDDTILEKLHYREFDNNKSYNIARNAYNDILSYVFPSMGTIKSIETMDGITIKEWWPGRCFKGIILNFWDNFERKTCFRCIEFKGTAKDFKAKVWQKFKALKALKQEADAKYDNRKKVEKASETIIDELTEIAKKKFDKYQVEITQCGNGYRLNLEIYFNNKSELLDFCNKE